MFFSSLQGITPDKDNDPTPIFISITAKGFCVSIAIKFGKKEGNINLRFSNNQNIYIPSY